MSSIEYQKISREDLEAKFRELQDGIEVAASSAKKLSKVTGASILICVLVIAFLLGQKRGLANRTFVEVRRI